VGREGGTCEADDHSTEPTPVDVFIMLDRSSSMSDLLPDGTTRWQGVGEALRSFVEQAANEDLRVGFQYFGQSDGIDDSIDCNVDLYATPKVPIGLIAETGPQILAEIDALLPATQTPTWAALQGAWQYARQWMESGQSSGRPTVVVLVTDGMPTQCEVTSTVEIGWAAQEELLEEPSIRTFVVGAGPYESNYDRIALWGGTDHAFKISDGTASTDLLDALLDITLRGIACEYTIPDSPDSNLLINPKEVRMLYWSDRMAQPDVAEEIPWVRGRDWCGSLHGGWFYDDELAPTKIEVCPCTCARFRQGSVEIQYGCIPLGR
jgi:hypothetical protein